MILEFSEIHQKMEQIYKDIPEDIQPDCSDLRLKDSKLSSAMLDEIEFNLNVKLPYSFKACILKYDFGDLIFGGIWFGSNQNYAQILIKNNHNEKGIWWGSGDRPINYLYIADSDGYVILLNTENEEILAYLRSESWHESTVIAYNFEVFARAAGTLFVQRECSDYEQIKNNVFNTVDYQNNCKFWNEIAE